MVSPLITRIKLNIDSATNFRFLQKVSTTVNHIETHSPSDYRNISTRINAFFEKTEKLGFKKDMISTH